MGEKIKRARIYKGYTLKDICDDKISLSKMSCIENNKIKPEDWVLKYVSQKLDIKYDYLKQEIRDQISNNLETIKSEGITKDYEENIKYNLNYADTNGYNDLAFELMHLLIIYYIGKGSYERIPQFTAEYYDYCQKVHEEDKQIVYYMDMAAYLYNIGEYGQAVSYYNNVRRTVRNKGDYVTLSKVTYNEIICYVMLEDFEKAYEVSVKLVDLIKYAKNDLQKARDYELLAALALKKGKSNFKEYELAAYELYGNNLSDKAQAIYNFSVAMFETGDNESAIEYTNKALSCYPEEDKNELVSFMLAIVETLVQYNVLELGKNTCDEALNYAIDLNNAKYIERSYYFKSVILQKSGDLNSAEVYLNLSLDSLTKFGSRMDIYKRYLELGNLYHKLGSANESLKYFNLAISLYKKL